MSIIKAGTYKGRGVDGSGQLGRASTGAETVGVDVEFIGGEHEGFVGTVLLYLTQDAAPYAVEKLRALGWTGDDFSDLQGISTNEVDVVVKYEMYKGEEKMRLDIRTNGGRMKVGNPIDKRGAAALNAKFAHLMKAKPADDFDPNF